MTAPHAPTGPSGGERRRHVACSVPRAVRDHAKDAAAVHGWPVARWVLTAASEQHHALADAIAPAVTVARRGRVDDTVLLALYVTLEERAELDEQAQRLGLNRSAYVTAVCQLAAGHDVDDVLGALQA